MVVLRHTLPDASSHFDWMIEHPHNRSEHRLITFRCQSPPNQSELGEVEKLPDHRAAYLDYQGELSRNRGSVIRITQGRVRFITLLSGLDEFPSQTEALIQWDELDYPTFMYQFKYLQDNIWSVCKQRF